MSVPDACVDCGSEDLTVYDEELGKWSCRDCPTSRNLRPLADRISERERMESREQLRKETSRARRRRTGEWVFRGYK